MTKLHLDVLDRTRSETWQKLGPLSKNGAVLGGGTAIALQIGHRVSEDFDLFLNHPVGEPERRKAFEILIRPVFKQLDNPDQMTLISGSGVKLTLLYFPFPPIHELIQTDATSMFDLADLASNKAYVIGRRGTWRDYVDLYFLLKEGFVTMTQVVDESSQRFGDEFGPKLFLEQLVYTADLGKMEVGFLRDEVSEPEIVRYFEAEVKKYLM